MVNPSLGGSGFSPLGPTWMRAQSNWQTFFFPTRSLILVVVGPVHYPGRTSIPVPFYFPFFPDPVICGGAATNRPWPRDHKSCSRMSSRRCIPPTRNPKTPFHIDLPYHHARRTPYRLLLLLLRLGHLCPSHVRAHHLSSSNSTPSTSC